MLSTCPNCLNQVNHHPGHGEVKCSACGSVFATFLKANTGSFEEEASGSSAKLDLQRPEPSVSLKGFDPLSQEVSQLHEISTDEKVFEESNSVIREIRAFGEGLESEEPSQASLKIVSPIENPLPLSSPVVVGGAPASAHLLTSGDTLPGYEIVEFLNPISALVELGPSDSPLQRAFDELSAQAERAGGNAVVAVRWSLSADKVLISGTVVKCERRP